MANLPLATFGGLVASMDPSSVPEGASPRTYDCDFTTAGVRQRPGCQNVYSYSGESEGPNPAFAAANTSIGNPAWSNPGNILLNGASYATCALSSSASDISSTSTGTSSGGGVAWSNPGNIDSNSAFASVSLSAGGTNYFPSIATASVSINATPSNQSPPAQSAVLSGFASVAATSATVYVSLNGSLSASQGGGSMTLFYSTNSGATWTAAEGWNATFSSTVPISITGITNISTIQIKITATGGCGPTGFCSITLSVTGWYVTVAGSGQLTAQTLKAAITGLSVPSGATITGLGISFNADYSGTSPSFMVQLNVGNTEPPFTLTTSPVTYTAGGNGSLWGYSSWSAAVLSSLVVNFFASSTGTCTINVNTLKVTVYYTTAALASDYLDVKEFTFSIPGTQTVTGIGVAVSGFSSSNQTITAALIQGSSTLGSTSSPQTLPGGPGTVTFGGASSSWGASLSPALLNANNFGVRLQVTGAGTANLNYITVTVYLAPAAVNFNYIGEILSPTGTTYNLGLDASGNWWLENCTANPGVFTQILSGTAAGSFGSSATVYDRAFVTNMTLTGQVAGSDIPRQYNFEGGWWDRVTQVGPGGAPNINSTTSAGTILSISSATTALVGSIYITTLTYTGTEPAAGTVGAFSGFTDANFTGLNSQTLNILGGANAPTSTTFAVQFGTAAVGATSQTATFTPQYTYGITSITQPTANPLGSINNMLWSAGPGSTSTGTTITVYYAVSYPIGSPFDTTLVNAFNAGYPVYVYISGCPFGNGIWQVTSIGNALPASGSGLSHWRWYFTYSVPTASYQQVTNPSGSYQMTQGTMVMATAVPGLQAGSQVTVASANPAAWDGSYSIVQDLTSGAFNITATELDTTGTATYTWVLTSGVAPATGQLVTVTNTDGANGILNVVNAVIATASGSTSGTFTITGFPPPLANEIAPSEEGQATTAGTQFIIDPGAANFGSTSVNPIYGTDSGGTLTVIGVASGGTLPIGAGTRQAVWIFITRNGLYTAPGPPVTFTIAEGANYLVYSQAPIGPPNVVARLLACTEAGSNGIPGANFYTTTVPTLFTVNGVQYTSSSFLIPDNVTTSGRFTFSDSVLLQGDAIDIPGNNLFNLIEIGNPAVIFQNDDITYYIGCQNKIQNFVNLSFDGGYLQPTGGSNPIPLGWNVDSAYNFVNSAGTSNAVTLRNSPVFGNSLYVLNGTGSNQNIIGMVTQSAFQDAWNEPILNPNGFPVPYSVRITCRTPSSQTSGNIVVDLVNSNNGVYGSSFGSFTFPLASMTNQFATHTGVLVAQPGLSSIPSGLLLRVYGAGILNNGDFEIDRLEIFPTNQPVLTNTVLCSYPEEPEQVDGIDGQLTLNSSNQQPVYGATVIHDQIVFKKASSIVEVEQNPNYPPAQWSTREVSARGSGTCGPNAFAQGDEWDLSLSKDGFYVYSGGQPMPVSRELQGFPAQAQFWDTINWNAAQTFWLANDLHQRRFYAGVAMTTPNFWLPSAPTNINPTSPNVILMCNYDGCPTAQELEAAAPVHVTMFGNLKAMDMRRKWDIWQIASPYGGVVMDGLYGYQSLLLCNGIGSGKVYRLVDCSIQDTDDGTPITPLYTTAGQPDEEKAAQVGIQAGQRYAWKWMARLSGSALANQLRVRHLQDSLSPQYPVTAAYIPPLVPTPPNPVEWRAEVRGNRIFTEYSMNLGPVSGAGWFSLVYQMCEMQTHPWGQWRNVSS